MLITLMWKEYREQRSVWLALPAFTALMIVGVWWLLEQSGPVRNFTNRRDCLMALAVILAGTYGLVCGAMLLANERESGTLVFIDALTGLRAPLWRSKLLAGVVLTLAQSLLLVAAVTAFLGIDLESLDQIFLLIAWLMALTWIALSALACGLLMSACFGNVLAAAATAVSVFCLSIVLTGLLSALMEYLFKGSAILMFAACQSGLTLAALEGSRRVFCSSDRLRLQRTVDRHDAGHGGPSHAGRGWGALLWLVYQQGRAIVWSLLGGALVLTVVLATGDVLAWPLISGMVGIACGLCTFAPEQASGAGRFLGFQRLPPGRVWLAKVGAWFVAACGIATMALLLEGIVHQRTLVAFVDSAGLLAALVLWLTFGFAAGQLLTLLVRKTAIAALLAGVLAGGLVLLWLPSLIVGGVHAWQWLAVPTVLLLAGRSVVWPWWSGTFGNWRSLMAPAGCGLLLAGWLGANLGGRAIEVPAVGTPFDVAAFEASLPTPEQNQTGRLIRRAAQEANLGLLRQAVHLPGGMITDPRVPDPQLSVVLDALQKAAAGLRTEAEEQVAQGDQGAALDIIVDLLALSRQVRQHAPAQVCRTGAAIEAQALEALERWQGRSRDQPKLLARALKELMRHEAELPPPADQIKASYLAFRADLDALNGVFSFPKAAFQAPWERARLERTGNAWFAGWLRAAESEPWKSAACVASVWRYPWVEATQGPGQGLTVEHLSELLATSPMIATLLDPHAPWPNAAQALRKVRLAELRLAIALYWGDNWQEKYEEQPTNYLALPPPPMKLLVPRYLPNVPVDPLKGQPLQQ